MRKHTQKGQGLLKPKAHSKGASEDLFNSLANVLGGTCASCCSHLHRRNNSLGQFRVSGASEIELLRRIHPQVPPEGCKGACGVHGLQECLVLLGDCGIPAGSCGTLSLAAPHTPICSASRKHDRDFAVSSKFLASNFLFKSSMSWNSSQGFDPANVCVRVYRKALSHRWPPEALPSSHLEAL